MLREINQAFLKHRCLFVQGRRLTKRLFSTNRHRCFRKTRFIFLSISLSTSHCTRPKYGLDSEIVASFCESFATHVDLPKEKWFKYHPPIEVKVVEPIKVEEKTITYNVDPTAPTAYIEKPPFPVRIKDHAKASTVVHKSNARTPTPSEKIKVEHSIAMVKDLLVDNIDCNIPNFQFGMLYIGHSCISYFIAFHFTILEILSNSRILGETRGFHRFHI